MMDLTCWWVHFTLWEWFRSCALLAFIQPEISIKIQKEDWRSLWLQNVRLSLAPNLIMLMDVQYRHPPVSLASSCYQGILKIYLDMISYSSFHLCLQNSSRAALGNRIQGLSCGEAIVSLSGNGFASAHYCFFWCLRFRERNKKALLEVLETRCMRMYVCTCPSPFKVTILRYLQASSSLVSHRYLLQNCCTQPMEHSCPWMKRHFPRIEDPIHDSVHILADPVAHRHDQNCPRSTGVGWHFMDGGGHSLIRFVLRYDNLWRPDQSIFGRLNNVLLSHWHSDSHHSRSKAFIRNLRSLGPRFKVLN